MPNLTECTRCGALAAFVEPARPDFWNAPHGVCETCRDRDRQPQGEAVRLFTPAPVQLDGQSFLDLRDAEVCGGTGAHDGQTITTCEECGR